MMKAMLVVLGLLGAAGASHAACSGSSAQTVYEYRSVPPLLIDEPDAELWVSIKSDGCVRAHFPQHDVRHGDFELLLDRDTFARTSRQLDAAGVVQFSHEALRGRLHQASRKAASQSHVTVYRTVDENIVEFRFVTGSAKFADVKPVRLATLQNDLLELPGDSALLGVAAADEAFREIAARTQAAGTRIPR